MAGEGGKPGAILAATDGARPSEAALFRRDDVRLGSQTANERLGLVNLSIANEPLEISQQVRPVRHESQFDSCRLIIWLRAHLPLSMPVPGESPPMQYV